jgi:hypothetical protein
MGKWTEDIFFKGRNPMAKTTQEEMLNFPGMKGNANQNQFRSHLTLGWLATLKNKNQQQKLAMMPGVKGTLIHCWWEFKLVQQLWKNSMEATQ